ncbi:MAG: UDP-glucose 4-epimerase GalE [Chitinophagales bacterium]|nr:UDP-glucose 4-epimerase GalE [Chitinophagales bacterium]
MHKILVTGGTGYIGSHTITDLIDHGFDVVSVDNHVKSDPVILKRLEEICGKPIKNYPIDLKELDKLSQVFIENPDISGIIHFAAYKSVPESVEFPLDYYENNLLSLMNLLRCVDSFAIPYFIFSSSCSIYGNVESLPVTEKSPIAIPESPYANTKKIGEEIIDDFCKNSDCSAIKLRYFNPVGAHKSIKIGELPVDPPMNLVPRITQTAAGLLDTFYITGTDYDTRDGTCIRDYLHVMDIANAHTKSLEYLLKEGKKGKTEVFNIGSGTGYTVLEIINAFQEASGMKLNYKTADRRAGDVVAIYADSNKAKEKLGWSAERSLREMLFSAWKWQEEITKLQP